MKMMGVESCSDGEWAVSEAVVEDLSKSLSEFVLAQDIVDGVLFVWVTC